MKKVMKRNDMAIYWLENQNPFFLKCPWQGVHFIEQIEKKLAKNKTPDVIADELETEISVVKEIIENIKKNA